MRHVINLKQTDAGFNTLGLTPIRIHGSLNATDLDFVKGCIEEFTNRFGVASTIDKIYMVPHDETIPPPAGFGDRAEASIRIAIELLKSNAELIQPMHEVVIFYDETNDAPICSALSYHGFTPDVIYGLFGSYGDTSQTGLFGWSDGKAEDISTLSLINRLQDRVISMTILTLADVEIYTKPLPNTDLVTKEYQSYKSANSFYFKLAGLPHLPRTGENYNRFVFQGTKAEMDEGIIKCIGVPFKIADLPLGEAYNVGIDTISLKVLKTAINETDYRVEVSNGYGGYQVSTVDQLLEVVAPDNISYTLPSELFGRMTQNGFVEGESKVLLNTLPDLDTDISFFNALVTISSGGNVTVKEAISEPTSIVVPGDNYTWFWKINGALITPNATTVDDFLAMDHTGSGYDFILTPDSHLKTFTVKQTTGEPSIFTMVANSKTPDYQPRVYNINDLTNAARNGNEYKFALKV